MYTILIFRNLSLQWLKGGGQNSEVYSVFYMVPEEIQVHSLEVLNS